MFYDMQAVMELLGTLNTVRPAPIYANRYFSSLFAHKKYFSRAGELGRYFDGGAWVK